MNIPNFLTCIRLALVPTFIIIFFSSMPNAAVIASLIFVLAGLTDVLDGYLARKYNWITKWGSIIDPLADKLMSITVLVCLTVKGLIPIWILYVIGIKEIIMITGAVILIRKDTFIPARSYGKIATLLFYIAVIMLEIYRPVGLVFIYITVLATLFALYKYIKNFLDINHNTVED